jgi:hypothetical protein
MVSLSEHWCTSGIFIFFSFFYLLSLLLVICEERGEKKIKKNVKSSWRHNEALVMISLVLFEKYQRDKSNDTKKGHKCWPECATRVVWRQMNPNIFGQLVWPNSVTVRDLPCCRWICFIDIFPIVSMVSLLEFCCVFEVFFFLSFLIFLSILSLFSLV